MIPVLKIGFEVVVRDRLSLQVGRRPWRVLVLPRNATTRAVLSSLDGVADWSRIVTDLHERGLDGEVAERTLRQLRDVGALDDASVRPRLLRRVPDSGRQRILRDIDAWSSADPEPSSGRHRFAARQARWIAVSGDEPVAALLVPSIRAASVGHVEKLSPTAAESFGGAARPDLLIHLGPASSPVARACSRLEQPHLLVDAVQGHGIVGPLVLPGTSCGRCVDLHLQDDDPAHDWLTLNTAAPFGPLDALTTTALVALITAQAVQYIERRTQPRSVNGRLILSPHGGTIHRTVAPPHPACECRLEAAPTSAVVAAAA